jgi:hypothetical protein
MNADDELLASAYLDGELTDDERRIAESDPAVMAEVERLRALRARLGDVEPPSIDARERALAAALRTFDDIHATPPAAPAPAASPAVDIWWRRDPMRWLGAAAAILAIGLLAVVVVNGFGGSEDDSASDTADEPASESAVQFATEEPINEAANDSDALSDPDAPGGADMATERAGDTAAEMGPADEPLVAEAPASEPAEEALDAAADDDMAEEAAATTAPAMLELRDPEEFLDGEPITIPAELSSVGRHLLDLIDRGELPPTPNHSCPYEDVLASGVVLEDDDEVDVYLAVTPTTGVVLAIDQDTCRVLLAAELQP